MGLLSGQGPGAYKSVDRTNFTATSGQTTFTVTQGYYVGDTEVFLNGIKLVENEDYTALNGSTIVLLSGAAAGDTLQVVSYNQFAVSNTYTKSESDTKYMVASGLNPMTSYLRAPNYGVSSWSDSASASLEASVGAGEQGVGVKAFGRSVATTGGDILYTADSRGAGGRHRFGYWNGTTFTETAKIDASGRFTIPNQPAFFATKAANLTEGSGERPVGDWASPTINIGSRFNNSNGRFTADVSGTYMFAFNCMSSGTITGDHQVRWRKNGSIYAGSNMTAQGGSWMQTTVVCVMYLNSGDYAEPAVYSGSTSSSIQVYGGSYSHVSGHLIG